MKWQTPSARLRKPPSASFARSPSPTARFRYSEFGGGKVLLKPASPGTGLIAGNTIRAVLEAAGVRDIVAKSLGSSNHANVVKATLQALASLRTSDQVLADRGKKKEKAI